MKLLLILSTLIFCTCSTSNLSSGDLIFVASENSDFEKAIVEVSQFKDKEMNFSHVGIINVTDTGIFVVEAVPEKGVVYTEFQEFKNRNNNSLYIGKLKSSYKKHANTAIGRACSHLGKDYDYAFDLENDLYYCSELVYDAYKYASKKSDFFETPNMTFKKEGTDEILPFWADYFEKLDIPIPEGRPGINPNCISCSDKLIIYKHKKNNLKL